MYHMFKVSTRYFAKTELKKKQLLHFLLRQWFLTGSQVKRLGAPRRNAKVFSECHSKQLIRLITIVFISLIMHLLCS